MTKHKDKQIVIFTHFGRSTYLDYTLECARRTNPEARLILLGDERNQHLAEKHGWEHYKFSQYKGHKQEDFNAVFRHVQGIKHSHLRNGRDWLRFVFERWFFIEGFLRAELIDRFWHFDSDTMIMQDLRLQKKPLLEYEFTVQCNGTCLNGIINTEVVTDFCDHICDLFENTEFLERQQKEFDTINPHYAFTEMRAFDNYKSRTSRKWCHLMSLPGRVVFDDALCQSHDFDMVGLAIGRTVKNIYSRNGVVYGRRKKNEVQFVTLNLSWLPDAVFSWARCSLDTNSSISCDVRWTLIDRLRGAYRNLLALIRRMFWF